MGGTSRRSDLLNRARSGVLKSFAKTLHIEGDTRETVTLKPNFWDWDRYSYSSERWETGDFSVSIDGLQHDAIGVAFDLAGLLEMLPLDRRPEFARRVSVAGDPGWVTAKAARAFMYNELGVQPVQAGALLLDQCRLGFVAARAVLRQQSKSESWIDWDLEEREWDVPLWFWENFTAHGSSQDWERGVFKGSGSGPNGRCWITLTGLHFSHASLKMMKPRTPEPEESVSQTTLPGGRPPAAFWDDLWCAVWGRVFRGELIPERQADVERAMLEWAMANDKELSESAVKPRARKLFAEFNSEGENPKH
ncbi:MAG: hypothetical protein ABIW58_02860 [Sphingomicrobium sp.]